MESKPPLPPVILETVRQKVQMAEDAWNTRDPERVALAYTEDSEWHNRSGFFRAGGDQVVPATQMKQGAGLSVEEGIVGIHRKPDWRALQMRIPRPYGQWFRAYDNEMWELATDGLMQKRFASINDIPIEEAGEN